MRQEFPPLTTVGTYFAHLGSILERVISGEDGGEFIPHATVRRLSYRADGALTAEIGKSGGGSVKIDAKTVILGLGGRADWMSVAGVEILPGVRLADFDPVKAISSDQLFTAEGLRRAAVQLGASASKRVVILGGSHSAFCGGLGAVDAVARKRPSSGRRYSYRSRGANRRSSTRTARRRKPMAIRCLPTTSARARSASTASAACAATDAISGAGSWPGRCEPEPRMAVVDVATLVAESLRVATTTRRWSRRFGYRAQTLPIFDQRGRRIGLRADRRRRGR